MHGPLCYDKGSIVEWLVLTPTLCDIIHREPPQRDEPVEDHYSSGVLLLPDQDVKNLLDRCKALSILIVAVSCHHILPQFLHISIG